jgi:pyruvate dehydrogenase E2 component (dihydrolipoamide acetyltransferase)
MPREFKLPDVGEGVAEGEIVNWLVEEGDPVTEDQPVAEVETDKAVVEVPSPVNGTVQQLHYEAGAVVEVGSVIVTFAVEGEEVPEEAAGAEVEPADESAAETEPAAAGDATAAEAGAEEVPTPEGRVFASPSVRRLAREHGISLQAVEGTGPSGRVTEQDVRAAAEAAQAAPEEAADEADVAAEDTSLGAGPEGGAAAAEGAGAAVEGGVEPAGRDRTLATPKARGVAKELGVDIDQVPAVEQRDGESYVTEAAIQQYAGAQQAAQAADAAAVAAGAEPEERVEYRGVRRTIGDRMEESKYTAPHVSHHDTVDATRLVEVRQELKAEAEAQEVKLTYMPFIMKAVVAALKEFPYLNSSLDEEAEEIVLKQYYNIGVAVATDAGLMVPVVKHVDQKGLLEIAAEVNDLAAQARDRSIALSDLQGSTFSITNFGAIGGEYATPIINYPEVGILGLGAIEERPVAENGEVVAKPTLPLSLSIDHRVVDGAIAAEFTNRVMEYINNPALLLLE